MDSSDITNLTPTVEDIIKKYLENNLKVEVKADHEKNKIEVEIKLNNRKLCKDTVDIRYLKTR